MLTGRLERTDEMSKWDYKVIRWDALVGPSAWQSLEKNLIEYGAQGWRFDRRETLQVSAQPVGSQPVEFAILIREMVDVT